MHEKNRHTKDGAINLTNYSALRISTHNLRVCDFTVLGSTINPDNCDNSCWRRPDNGNR